MEMKSVLAIIGIMFLTGCGLLRFDNRENIALHTLYGNNLSPEFRVFNAALETKFPMGSSQMYLVKYVELLKGTCSTTLEFIMNCTIPQTSTICLSTSIKIKAILSQEQIISIIAEPEADGC